MQLWQFRPSLTSPQCTPWPRWCAATPPSSPGPWRWRLRDWVMMSLAWTASLRCHLTWLTLSCRGWWRLPRGSPWHLTLAPGEQYDLKYDRNFNGNVSGEHLLQKTGDCWLYGFKNWTLLYETLNLAVTCTISSRLIVDRDACRSQQFN